jgi:hypothetical protein
MLTIKHIELYKSYNGDGDGFVRCASDEEKAYMTYKDWSLIDDFIQDIYLVKKGLASKYFSDNLCEKMQKKCDSQETINKLKQLVV